MNNLPRLIGKAPSELTYQEFKDKLISERARIRRGLDYFREVKYAPKKKKTKAKKISDQLAAAGLTPKQFLAGIKLLEQQAKGKALETKPSTPPKGTS